MEHSKVYIERQNIIVFMKYFFTGYLLLLNIMPMFAAPRDDRNSGTSGITLLIVIALFIIMAINAKDDKKR